jgi:hypothetical protein
VEIEMHRERLNMQAKDTACTRSFFMGLTHRHLSI